MQRNHGRWLGRNLLIAVAGISALLAAQSFEAPCEISWHLPLGQGSVPATIVDVAVASLVSCALIIAGNRGRRALASVPLAIASASCCLMGLAVQGTGEPLSIFGLILMSAGGTVLLFCWLAAVCAQRDIGIVELMIEIEVLASAAAILPSLLSASWCQALAGMSVAASAVALCLIQRPAPSASETERSFTLEPSSLAKILCSFFVIGLVVGSLQYSVFLQQAEGEMFPVIITAISRSHSCSGSLTAAGTSTCRCGRKWLQPFRWSLLS